MFSVFVDNILLLTLCAPQSLVASGFDVHSRALLCIILQASQVKIVEGFSANLFLLQPYFKICWEWALFIQGFDIF